MFYFDVSVISQEACTNQTPIDFGTEIDRDVPTRLFCIGSLVILDVECCY